MPPRSTRAASAQPPTSARSTRSQNSTTSAASTSRNVTTALASTSTGSATLRPPTLTRRSTRARTTGHSPSPSPVPPREPSPDENDSVSRGFSPAVASEENEPSSSHTPASALAEPLDELPEDDPADDHTTEGMYGQEKGGLRGRTVVDIAGITEEGRISHSRTSSYDNIKDGQRIEKRRGATPLASPMLGATGEKLHLQEEEDFSEGLTSTRDKQAFALLVVLYLYVKPIIRHWLFRLTSRLQGIPLGLTFGTLPFLLKQHLSYSQLAIFALSTWPYSLKLLWSPIVDAWFLPRWGRRKSWIVPVQAIVGLGLWQIGGKVEGWLDAEEVDINFITMVFGSLILAAATQDIAVDGWALTLLSPPNLSYASTAQTIGLGIGNALAFTVFLAFNSVDFSNRYFRTDPLPYGLISLGGYIRFWGVVFVVVTVGLAVFKKEDPVSEDDPDMDVKKVYKVMWSIVQLKNIQSFLIVHLICKIGFQVNESVTSLKLLEKGLSKEDMAVAVLLDFPAQMAAGWLAAKWSRPAPISHKPLSGSKGGLEDSKVLRPWLYAFVARLVMATVAALVVYNFPQGQVSSSYFGLVVATTLLSSLASTVQFVGITAFHTQIADPLIGGTYMTLLNTVSNLGGTWPKPLILRSVDMLTTAYCSVGGDECVSEHGKHLCENAAGHCVVKRDGYYIMTAACVTLSAILLMTFILPTIKRLQSLPISAWRVKLYGKGGRI